SLVVGLLLQTEISGAQTLLQTLLQWNTFGNQGTEILEPSIVNNVHISPVNLTLGAGITAGQNGNRFGGTGWFDAGNTPAGNTIAEAITGNNYIEFIVTPGGGYSFTPSTFVFNWDRSATGPSNVALRSSADGFSTNIGTVTGIAVGAFATNTITISTISGLTTSTTFRIYGYGATAIGESGGFDIGSNTPNVTLNGTVCQLPTAPSVTSSTICSGNTAVLNVVSNNLNGATAWNWYETASGGTPIATGTTFTTPVLFSTTSFYVVGEGGCVTPGGPRTLSPVSVFPLPTATASNDGASICLGGTLHLTSTGGIYFNWTGPNGFNSTLQNPIIPNVTNVNGGLYTFTVVSANGCAGSANTTVVLHTPIIPTVNHTDVTVFGGSDGTASASAIGGVGPPYSFSWSNGDVTAAISSLSIGVYSVTITDPNGCTAFDSTVISQPAQQSVASDYFRAKNSGGWSSEEVWESSHDEINWFDATLTPNDQANTILIGNGKTIEISAETVTADQLVIEASGSLSIINEGSLQLLNGAIEADDMVCDGVLGIIGAGLGGGGTVGMNGSSTLNVQSAFLENITINVLSGCTFNMLSSDIHFDSNLTINNYTTCDYEGGNLWFSNTSPTFNNYGTFHFFDNNGHFIYDDVSGEAFNNMVGGNVIINEGFTLNTDLVTFNNYGSVDIQNGTLNINNASGIHSGTYTLNSDAQ
ncbi:MAG: hypothetical protein D4R43_03790, partial [Sphingobacteriales bacterium]